MTKPNKNTIETIKTVVIAVLITAIVAFIGGMVYANKQHDVVDAAVQAATPVAQPEAKK